MKVVNLVAAGRSTARRVAVPGSCAAAAVAAACLWQGRWLTLAWALQAGVAFVLAAAGNGASRPETPAGTREGRTPHLRAGSIMAGLGAGAVLVVSLAALTSWQRWAVTAMVVFPIGLAALALGVDLAAGWPAWWVGLPGRVRHHARRPASWALAAIVLAGAAFRLGTFGDFPPPDGFPTVEEAQAGQNAMRIASEPHRPWELATSQYLSGAAFSVAGRGMGAHRLPSVLLGCMIVPVFYLLARTFVGVPAALVASALFAVSRWPVQTSWYNDWNFTPLLAFTLGLVLLLRSGPDRRPSLTVGAAAFAGMIFFEYITFRPLAAIAVAVVAGQLLRARGDRARRVHAALFAGTLLLFAPIAAGALRSGASDQFIEPFLRNTANRSYYTSDLSSFVRQRLERLAVVADGFVVRENGNFFDTLNARSAPLLDPATAVMFVAGLGVAALRPRRRGHLLLVGSFLLLLVGCTVVTQNYDFRRLAVLAPFAFLFVAIACDVGLSALDGAGRRRTGAVCVAIVISAATAWNADFLFRKLARSHVARAAHRNDYTTASFLLAREWRGEHVVLLTPEDDFYPFNFFEGTDYTWILPPGIEGCVEPSVTAALDEAVNGTEPLLLVVQRPFPLEEITAEVLRRVPSANCLLRPDPDDGQFDLAVCRVGGRTAPTESYR